jgi:hypothetical protein
MLHASLYALVDHRIIQLDRMGIWVTYFAPFNCWRCVE